MHKLYSKYKSAISGNDPVCAGRTPPDAQSACHAGNVVMLMQYYISNDHYTRLSDSTRVKQSDPVASCRCQSHSKLRGSTMHAQTSAALDGRRAEWRMAGGGDWKSELAKRSQTHRYGLWASTFLSNRDASLIGPPLNCAL